MGLLVEYFAHVDDGSAAAAPPSAESVVDGRGIEPTVQLATLEELLTGRSFEEILDDPGAFATVAEEGGGEALVTRLGERFEDALLAADETSLARVAGPWSQTEEFDGQTTPDELTVFLTQLRELAAQARASGKAMYCRLSV